MAAKSLVLRLVGLVLVSLLCVPLAAEEAVPYYSAEGNHEMNQEIVEALRMPLPKGGLEFIDTPLEEVIALLRDEYDIEIVIDKKSLDDLGIDVSQPIAAHLRNISLQSALNLILRELELTYLVTNEVLLITTQEEADSRLIVCVYPVQDLVDSKYRPTEADKKLRIPAELIPLANALTETVASDTWKQNGGHTSIGGVRPGLLVIPQTQAVHEEIRNTLAAIRRAKQFAHEHQAPSGMASEMGMEPGGYGGMMGEGGFGREGGSGGMRGGFGGMRGGFGGEFGPPPLPSETPQGNDPFEE